MVIATKDAKIIEVEDSVCNFDLLEFGICWEMFSLGKQQIYHSFSYNEFQDNYFLVY